MTDVIELRELRVFLTLAEELHFGRSAERLGLTQSRVSQSLRALERKLDTQLVHRTSRQVSLTPQGARFRANVGPVYSELVRMLADTRAASHTIDGTLRLGLLSPTAGGPRLIEIIKAFERRHCGCEVHVSEVPLADPLGPLRRGEIDVMASRLPVRRADLVVGPVLSREPRVLAVASDHPLAQRAEISIEDVADHMVAPVEGYLPEVVEALIPHRTPSGRPIRRYTRRVSTAHEVTTLVARGQIVHPTVPSFADYFGHPDIVYIPIRGLPRSATGLLWRRRDRNPALRAFIRVTREVLRDHGTERPSLSCR